MVAGITEVEVASSQQIMDLLHGGNLKRSQAATAANEVTNKIIITITTTVCLTRAHAIFDLRYRCQRGNQPTTLLLLLFV